MKLEENIPVQKSKLKCCYVCKLVKNEFQFRKFGCQNGCFEMGHDVDDKITTNFSGLIANMRPKESWVSKWNDIQYLPTDGNGNLNRDLDEAQDDE
mmetsp:Transcript_5782/g.9908  ORF Transcript_5782/g.9908 Transcript_5782/m.9908 type:complete len:96 (+) Transcript_5782:94-381(+)